MALAMAAPAGAAGCNATGAVQSPDGCPAPGVTGAMSWARCTQCCREGEPVAREGAGCHSTAARPHCFPTALGRGNGEGLPRPPALWGGLTAFPGLEARMEPAVQGRGGIVSPSSLHAGILFGACMETLHLCRLPPGPRFGTARLVWPLQEQNPVAADVPQPQSSCARVSVHVCVLPRAQALANDLKRALFSWGPVQGPSLAGHGTSHLRCTRTVATLHPRCARAARCSHTAPVLHPRCARAARCSHTAPVLHPRCACAARCSHIAPVLHLRCGRAAPALPATAALGAGKLPWDELVPWASCPASSSMHVHVRGRCRCLRAPLREDLSAPALIIPRCSAKFLPASLQLHSK
ncbi:uncharacterized protein LOC112971604 [Apteryx rowi]|uniref:uncharacterized protein LOC112971604 n=1 Tax=Apteryx rowi TaxID=308060 RepID=UPI000E1C912B|nr:uncharacterized protein LOC112971604 [Apteryx rowi]